jgi:hypothetical protein
MRRSHIASASDLVGCSQEEIAALESRYRVRLPNTYRQYLQAMGHRSGRLFTSDHMAVFYPYVIEMMDMFVHKADPSERLTLPPHSLLIASRLGDQFSFISCEEEKDSAVWHINRQNQPLKTHDSVISWLDSWCEEAERAIASGYFDAYPNGTVP